MLTGTKMDMKKINKQSPSKKDDSILHYSGVRVKSQMSDRNFVTSVEHEEQKGISRHKSNIGSLLNQFSKIKKDVVYQNHSNKSKDPGVVVQ